MPLTGSQIPIYHNFRPDTPYHSALQPLLIYGLDSSYSSSSNGPIRFVPVQVDSQTGGIICDTELQFSGTLSATIGNIMVAQDWSNISRSLRTDPSGNLYVMLSQSIISQSVIVENSSSLTASVGIDWSNNPTHLRTDANSNLYAIFSSSVPGVYITASLLPASLTNSVGIDWSNSYTHLRTDPDGNQYMLISGTIPGVYVTASLLPASLTNSVGISWANNYTHLRTDPDGNQYVMFSGSIPGVYLTASVIGGVTVASTPAGIQLPLRVNTNGDLYVLFSGSIPGTYITASIIPQSYITSSVLNDTGTYLTASTREGSVVTASVANYNLLTASISNYNLLSASVGKKDSGEYVPLHVDINGTAFVLASGSSPFLQGFVSSSFLSQSSDGEIRHAYTDKYGLLHTLDENSFSLPGNYFSPGDFSASFQAANMIGISGSSFTVNDTNCVVSYVQFYSSGSQVKTIINGQAGYTLSAGGNNYITCSHPMETSWFASTDLWYRVGIRYQEKAYAQTTDVYRQQEINPISDQYLNEILLSSSNIAAGVTSYPSATGFKMDGFKNLSVHIYMSGTGESLLKISGSNEVNLVPSWAWHDLSYKGVNLVNDTHSGSYHCSGSGGSTAGILSASIDYTNLNVANVRIDLSASAATNFYYIGIRRGY